MLSEVQQKLLLHQIHSDIQRRQRFHERKFINSTWCRRPKKNIDRKKCAQFQEEIVVANDLHAS